jgi:ABC-type phosphate transport system substrate-binding protein
LLYWNDSSLVANNPLLENVSQPIQLIIRDGTAGINTKFTEFLSTVNSDWAAEYGVLDSFPVDNFSHIRYSDLTMMISYVDLNPYSLTYSSVALSLSYADSYFVGLQRGDLRVDLNSPSMAAASRFFTPSTVAYPPELAQSDTAWPLALSTFFLVNSSECGTTSATARALRWWFADRDVHLVSEALGLLTIMIK